MKKEFFISDLHISHRNIVGPSVSSWKSGYRNFLSIADMNKAIIDSINNRVEKDDILYILGDITFNSTNYLSNLNCNNIHIIFGNHDREKIYHRCKQVASTSHYKEIRIDSDILILSHYPMRSWNHKERGSIHLFGHCHHNLPNFDKSMDVGWCKWRAPLSLEEIKSIIGENKGEWRPV